jgi:hypothetical protein
MLLKVRIQSFIHFLLVFAISLLCLTLEAAAQNNSSVDDALIAHLRAKGNHYTRQNNYDSALIYVDSLFIIYKKSNRVEQYN